MNYFKNLVAVFAFSLLILGLPTFASAQWRDRDNDDDYYGNGRNRDNDYRNNRNYNSGALRSAINRLKNRAESFERRLDRELDRGRYNGGNREDRLNDLAGRFTNAAERLEDESNGGRNTRNSYDEARQVVNLGQQLENALYRSRINGNVQNDWNAIRQDLYTISNAYGINYNNNRNNNRNGRGNGNWRNNIPFPLPF